MRVLARLSKKVNVQKYHGECLLKTGEVVFLTAKTTSEKQASREFHQYEIVAVLDILTEDQMMARKRRLKPSLIRVQTHQ